MFKVGICQCITRSLCKMCCAACQTCWFLFEDTTCFVCHKLKNTKRVNRRHRHRRRFRDAELGCSSDEESGSFSMRKLHGKRKDRVKSSFYPSRQNRYDNYSRRNRPRLVRLKSGELSVRVKANRSQRFKHSRQLQMRKLSNSQRQSALFKKRRFR